MHHPKLPEIHERMAEILGLDFPRNRWGDLERGALAAAKELGMSESLDQLAVWLASGNFDAGQLDVLAKHLTVGETYFFREPQTLEVFRTHIIPEIMAERFGKYQHINLWSAGCCTGEEPYTLAMLLKETIPDFNHWKISILATDLNPAFLQKAREGVYRSWSFRETPKALQSRYFHKEGAAWKIDESVRQMVDFRQVNLADPHFLSQLYLHHDFDLIFCRNVLMYFSPSLIHQVGLRFYEALRPQGWFVTSPVELSDELFPQFSKVQFPKCIVYRKGVHKLAQLPHHVPPVKPVGQKKNTVKSRQSVAGRSVVQEPPVKKAETLPFEAAQHLYRKGQYADCVVLCRSEMDKPGNRHAWQRLLARSYANLGRYEEALLLCRDVLKHHRLDTDIRCLMVTILTEQQESNEAVKLLNQVFYIDPDHLMAHLLMAGILRSRGNAEASRFHRKMVRKLLSGYEDQVVLDEVGGLTVKRILEMVE